MKWQKLIQTMHCKAQGGTGNPELVDIAIDSRKVRGGSLFIAIPGFKQDGSSFVNDAVKNGAAAILSAQPHHDCTVPWAQVENPRLEVNRVAGKIWNITFDTIQCVGITGTNGKTTIATLYHTLFRKYHGTQYSWMFGTIAYELGDRKLDAPNTTPEGLELLRFIHTSDMKPRAISMEVSSHALVLHRVEGFLFDVAVWSNLTQDHLDFHGTMEAYYEAKKRLFVNHCKIDGTAIINCDDAWGRKLIQETSGIKKITYGFSENADFRIMNAECTWTGTTIDVVYSGTSMRFTSVLTGKFNAYNMAALAAGALGLGYSAIEIQEIFTVTKTVSGRMQRVDIPAEYSVIVDYAHTPDALDNVLKTAKELTEGRLLCVFGCGGDRDNKKRPLMAEAVVRYCDEAIITNDNPRTEEPKKIIGQILDGVPLDFPHLVIQDRREAIMKAVKSAKKGDCIIIAGKGHETYQEVNGVRHHFDDYEVVCEVIKEFGNK